VRNRPLSNSSPTPFKDESQRMDIDGQKFVFRHGSYNIYLADSPQRCDMVNKLIKSMYSWRGYHTESAIISSFNPHELTLEASIGQCIVGTLTIGSDSIGGLLVDSLYQDEIMALRTE